MNQHRSTGREVDRDAWWSSTDVDYAYIVPADTVEIIEQVEPFWADAVLTVMVQPAYAAIARRPGRRGP